MMMSFILLFGAAASPAGTPSSESLSAIACPPVVWEELDAAKQAVRRDTKQMLPAPKALLIVTLGRNG
ncbi:hypothetical protein ONR75_12345 [Rhodopseudomonas sp. P2A-2r]|uniref:hypothetical protein n=1 Tax=Rhodopseudomonas sp. P2A-2r TaxID=2991972 RepID=UPI00223457C3|nr:hypothetical protein [Rhodopseudomonas sp. P2A-2r]UZE52426.1 hypothetical protein ONR75_12345 [Rhodopseudomonas sp. P2A-2r]